METIETGGSFTVVPNAKAWTSANWLLIRQRWLWRRLAVAIVAIWLTYSASFVAMNAHDNGWEVGIATQDVITAAWWTLALTAILILLTIGLTPWRARKHLPRMAQLAPATQFEFDSNGIRSTSNLGTVSLTWVQFERWLEGKNVLVLVLTQRDLIVVPKPQLDPDIYAALRTALIAAAIPKS